MRKTRHLVVNASVHGHSCDEPDQLLVLHSPHTNVPDLFPARRTNRPVRKRACSIQGHKKENSVYQRSSGML